MVYVPVKLRELDLIEKKTRMTVSQKELIDEESEKNGYLKSKSGGTACESC
jgi:hypothetical protein